MVFFTCLICTELQTMRILAIRILLYSLHKYCIFERNIETDCAMYIVKSRIKVKNDEQILPSDSLKLLLLSWQILWKCSRRGWASVKALITSSLLSEFNLAGCIAILAKLHIRPSVILVRREVRSLSSLLKLLSPSLDLIG